MPYFFEAPLAKAADHDDVLDAAEAAMTLAMFDNTTGQRRTDAGQLLYFVDGRAVNVDQRPRGICRLRFSIPLSLGGA